MDLLAGFGVGLAGVSLGFAGFAFALLATASLALLHPPHLVVPTVALLGLTLQPWLLFEHRHLLRWTAVRRIPLFTTDYFLALGVGLAAGTVLLALAAPAGGRVALGLLILAFVARAAREEARGARPVLGPGRAAARVVGLATGLLQGWLGTGGPPVVAYLTGLGVDRGTFIVAFAVSMLSTDVLRGLGYAWYGYWTEPVLALYTLSLPLAVGGFVLGIWLRSRIAAARVFRRVVLALLGINALALLARGLLG